MHFLECGAFTVHRQLDIVASTDHPYVIEGWSVFVGDQPSRANAAAPIISLFLAVSPFGETALRDEIGLPTFTFYAIFTYR